MADYDYMNRGSTTYGKGRLGTRLSAWDTGNSGDPGYESRSERYRDHVCRPVIVDPDGTMRPAVEFMAPEYERETDKLISKIEKVTEHEHAPSATAHKKSSATNSIWGKPVGQLVDKANQVNEVLGEVKTVANGLGRTGFSSGMFQRHTPNSGYGGTNGIGTDAWSRLDDGTNSISSSGWGRPISGTSNISTNGWGKPGRETFDADTNGWSRPGGGTYDSGSSGWSMSGGGTYGKGANGWTRPSGGTYGTGDSGWTRPNGGTYGTGDSRWSSPIGTTIHEPEYDGSGGKYGSALKNSWGRPHHVSWATPTSYEIPPSKTTSDIGSTLDYGREPTRLQSTTMAPRQGRFTASSPIYHPKETVETIDSREAARRYGSLSASPTAIQDTYTTTIDSREAAQKYNGSFV